MTRPLILSGGRIIDPSQGLDLVGDVVLVNGRITAELDSPDIDAARRTELAFTTREET